MLLLVFLVLLGSLHLHAVITCNVGFTSNRPPQDGQLAFLQYNFFGYSVAQVCHSIQPFSPRLVESSPLRVKIDTTIRHGSSSSKSLARRQWGCYISTATSFYIADLHCRSTTLPAHITYVDSREYTLPNARPHHSSNPRRLIPESKTRKPKLRECHGGHI